MAAGLGPLAPMGSLAARFRPLLEKPVPTFLEAMAEIDKAGVIPGVMNEAEVTFATAQDQKKFGSLKDDPLSVDGIACIMKYTAEDTQPPVYKDLNDKCYLKDRTNIDPYGMYVVGTLQHMKQTKPFPNGTVNRGVKADLKEDYQKGREFTWHGFCSVCTPCFVSQNTRRWC